MSDPDPRAALIAAAHKTALDAVAITERLESIVGDYRRDRTLAEHASRTAMDLASATQQLARILG